MTVVDDATGLRSDVHVDCTSEDRTGDVLALVTSAVPASGSPTVDGRVLDPSVPVVDSPLHEGAVLHFGAPAAATPEADGRVLRVVSGPSAGTQLVLPPQGSVPIGRGADCALVLADPDVSRRHAAVQVSGDQVLLSDTGSVNGVVVDGRHIAGPHPLRDGEVVQLGGSRLVLETTRRSTAALERAPDGALLLNRRYQVRRQRFVAPTVQLPTPLAEDDPRGLPVLAMVLPLVVSCVLALVLRNPIYLLFGLLSPVLMAGNWWTERRRRLAREARQEGSYRDKLRAARARIEAAVADEDADLRDNMPDPATVERIALGPRVELWSRRPGDDGWLDVRLGTADRPASVEVTGERPVGWEEPVLPSAPVGIDVDGLGVLGLAGPPPWLRQRLAWVLAQLAVLRSPDELPIVVLAPDADEDGAGWLRWLPHLRDPAGGVRAAWDERTVDELVRMLGAELDRRAETARLPRQTGHAHLLVVLSGAGALVRRPAVADLLARGPALGLRFVCTEGDERLLPDRCRAVLVDHGGRSQLRVDRGPDVAVRPDPLIEEAAERIARRLAPLRRVGDGPTGGGVPDSVRFADEPGIPTVDEVRAAWRLAPERTDVVVGRDADGAAVLDIARDGPHAVIAGTSGAGKSELLMSWMAGLALANDPTRLSVVFVDFKGGALFKDLRGLPHVVGAVTNLDERRAARALTSLDAELRRRQEQLNAAGAGDRGDYLRRAAADPSLPPFPRLLIVVDELAELKEQLPALVDGLVGVARIGRSLGVHLVLATQKPAGVVDGQIRANADLRICLRTANPGESMDVIESGDAADIPKDRPGRALVVRGGAPPRLVQTARVTTPATDGAAALRRAVALRWSDVAPPPPPAAPEDGQRTDLDVLVGVVAGAAAAEGLVAPYRPWTEPLPDGVALDTLAAVPFTLPLGLRDRPDLQRQEPLQVPLGTGHVVIVGSGRTGRTSALRAIAAGLARSASPEQVHVHAVDAAGGLAGLAVLPHVGVVVDADDPERLERLLARLVALVRERRQRLTSLGASSVEELRASGAPAPPHVVLLVDGWAGVTEGVDVGAPAAFQELLGGGAAAAGVTVCLAGDERLLKSRVIARADHRLCLRLNNATDATLLGLDIRNLPAGLQPGRALWAADGSEVQVPLLTADPAGPAQAGALRALGEELRGRHGRPDGPDAPLRLDPLPARIGLDEAIALGATPSGGCPVLLGVSGDRLGPVWTDLAAARGHLVIAGPSRSGRSTAAASIAASCPGRVVLVTARPGEPHRAAASRGVTVVDPAGLPGALDAGADLVVVDDADLLTLADELVTRLTGAGAPPLAVAAQLDAFGFGARGLVAAVRRGIGPVVLLSPPNHLAADQVGVTIERGSGFSGPAGRAYLSADGLPVLGQVPDVAVSSS